MLDPNNEIEELEEKKYTKVNDSLGDLLTFNIEFGYLEAVVRGFRSGFLKENEYRQLSQCETLDDVKVILADTDYHHCLQNIQNLTSDIITNKCWEKFVEEFNFLCSQATGQLATFLDYITYEYMIENIVLLVKSMINLSNPFECYQKCDPLGIFPQMKSLLAYEHSEDGFQDLYNLLIDSPVATYFARYFNSATTIKSTFKERDMGIISDTLKKFWLEDFYQFCQDIGGTTQEIMSTLLEFEADKRAINITNNSFNTSLNSSDARHNERQNLYNNFGTLYPEGINSLRNVTSFDSFMGNDMMGEHDEDAKDSNQHTLTLREVLNKYDKFQQILNKFDSSGRDFEDLITEEQVHQCEMAFEQQSHFACFYAYYFLKKQEINNIYWITQLITCKKQNSPEMNRVIPIFANK